jgi:hypothetical protein
MANETHPCGAALGICGHKHIIVIGAEEQPVLPALFGMEIT